MKKFIIILVVVAIVAGAWFVWFRPVPVAAPGGVAGAVEIGNNDTTPVITEELDSVAVPEIDAEFESINKDLNLL